MRVLACCLLFSFAACAKPAPPAPAPEPLVAAPLPAVAPPVMRPETVTVTARDVETDRELARAKIQLLERTAQLADAERRLADATTDVVRAMARLRTIATRAEAASAIAEAEVTLQQLRGRSGAQTAEEVRQAQTALKAASVEFERENFGGAVYLASQAKRTATAGRGRLAEATGTARSGEQAFAIPVPLTSTARVNLRAGPGTTNAVVATLDTNSPLTAFAWMQDWLRVTMADGRTAWVHESLVKSAGAP